MFKVRPRVSKNSNLEFKAGPLVDVTTNGENIPKVFIPAQNWPERWCTLRASFSANYERIFNFEVKEDDVFVVTFPKSGTTWVQEAIWLLMNDLNYAAAKSEDLSDRSVYMELSLVNPTIPYDSIERTRQLKSPRLIKTHLPAHLLPRQLWQRKNKIVYCARNIKDVVVSYFKFIGGRGYSSNNIDDFVSDLISNDLVYTPFWDSVLDFWQLRHEPNIFFTSYEQLKADLPAVLRALCEFLERPALTDTEMAALTKHLSFDSMKSNERTNPTLGIKNLVADPAKLSDFQFMRRGIVGAYKDELSLENQQRLDEWSLKCLQKRQVKASDIWNDN